MMNYLFLYPAKHIDMKLRQNFVLIELSPKEISEENEYNAEL